MRDRTIRWVLLVVAVGTALPLVGVEVGSLEFVDRPIEEILYAVAELAGRSIFPDQTIRGRGSFYFPGGSGEEALDLLLKRESLYLLEDEEVDVISRMQIIPGEGERFRFDARDIAPRALLGGLSDRLGITITFDSLPELTQTLHLRSATPMEVIEALLSPYPGYVVRKEGEVFNIQRGLDMAGTGGGGYFAGRIRKEGDSYSIEIDRGYFRQIMTRLFTLAGQEYSFLGVNNPVVENFHLSLRSFMKCLELLLEQGSSGFTESDGIYHIFDVEKNSVMGRFLEQRSIPIIHRPIDEVLSLIPKELIPSGGVVSDRERNALILYGTSSELGSIERLVVMLDQRRENWIIRRYPMEYAAPEALENLLPPSLGMVRLSSISSGRGVLVELPAERVEEFEGVLQEIDLPIPYHPVTLRYIRSSDLLESLPPELSREDIELTRDSSLVYLKGGEEKLNRLKRELERLDRPTHQIRYDLLVLQYSEERQFNWDLSLQNSVLGAGDQTAFLGSLGSALNLNFDITSAFGYAFSLKLDSDLDRSRARVLADTTLTGLSGERVKFQNTDTYRYRDTVKNLDTGEEETTGISREITSGLFLEVEGWVSGDEMITMTISATVSKRGQVSSTTTGILPSTSEKIVETHIRTPAGKPIAIGGLIQQEKGMVIKDNPLTSWIPLLGALFQKREEVQKNTEMVIYIIPHLVLDPDIGRQDRLQRYYRKYGRLFVEEGEDG